MSVEAWSIVRWKELIELAGTPCALLFTAAALHIDARVRRAETGMEITKQHRELWIYYDEREELHGLFEQDRDMVSRPLSPQESRFMGFLINHIRTTFYSRKAGIYVQPERLGLDIRETFSKPAPRLAWRQMKKYHDRKFVAFVDGILS